ncbi:phosphatase PAP2 family protein [Xylanimonas protaetiae]|uniref:Phosphatase PAP2 family protein n=1 Tax=Xylanimonas protaetiae TaxID=2509457 RepID=A0A4P6FEH9_9MICO|nr:phosphatase PAP2 family protein [Xylanimonas protaetiae]QAY69008.1 phosphatase PAP2 family protein [Xylanimonas protaetiae]
MTYAEGRRPAAATPPGVPNPGSVPRLVWWTAAAVIAVLFVALLLGAVHTVPGQRLDEHLLGRAQRGLWPPHLRKVIPVGLGSVNIVLAARAVRRRGIRRVAVATVVVGASTAASIALQHWLRRPALGVPGYAHNTLPSDHVTVAAALTVAAVVLWERRRWVEASALGCVLIASACVSSVHGFAHRPSDVVASVLLVGVVTCGCLAAVAPRGRRRQRARR